MCRTKASQTVKLNIRKMSGCLNSNGNDVDKKIVVQVFERRADPTKGATGRKRGTIQTGLTIALLQYQRIKGLSDEKQVDPYLNMHSRKVYASGKIAKAKKMKN